MFGFIHWTGQRLVRSSSITQFRSPANNHHLVCSLRCRVEANKLEKSLNIWRVDCFYRWHPYPGDDGVLQFLQTNDREIQWRADNTNIDFHLSAGTEQDIFTPPGALVVRQHHTCWGGGGGGGASLSIPSATVCNYVRLLGLTPGFSSTRKGQLTLRIKVLLFSSTV